MALIQCNECGQMVSDTALTCPHCGAQVRGNGPKGGQSSQSRKGIGSYALIAAMVLLGLAGGFALYKIVVKPSIHKDSNKPPVVQIDTAKVEQDIPDSLEDMNAEETNESDEEEVKDISQVSLDGTYHMAGHVDKYPVQMDLKIDGNAVEGRYRYTAKSPNDIKLVGSIKDGKMKLDEFNEDGEHTGAFEGDFDSGEYSGTFYHYQNGRNDMIYDFRLKCE